MRGTLITIEGTDGSGKGTIARLLAWALRSGADPSGALHDGAERPVCETREPSSGPIGQQIRKILRGEITVDKGAMGPLFAADRADHVADTIAPALARGDVVVCDRYDLSNVVYRAAETDGVLFRCGAHGCHHLSDEIAAHPDAHAFGEEPSFACVRCGAPMVLPYDLSRWARHRIRWASTLLDPPAPTPDLTVILDVPLDVASARRTTRGGPVELYDSLPLQRRLRSLYRCMPAMFPGRRIVVVDASPDPDTVAAEVLRWARQILPL